MAKKTKPLVFIVLVLIVVSWIFMYTKVPMVSEIEILQMNLHQVKPEILLEKKPIIIQDKIMCVDALVKTTFAYNYLVMDESFVKTGDTFMKARSKYTLLTSPFWDARIDIAVPGSDVNKFVSVKLGRNQVLILPAMWHYRTMTEKVKRIILDDLVTMFVYKYFSG